MRVSDLTAEVVLPLLRGRLGKPYRHLAECASTQRLFAAEAPEGATVTTDHQTEGRGRLGRRWHDAPGRALLCSIVLRPLRPISDWPQLSPLAGEAVAAALPLDASVLDPNDVAAVEPQRVRLKRPAVINVEQRLFCHTRSVHHSFRFVNETSFLHDTRFLF